MSQTWSFRFADLSARRAHIKKEKGNEIKITLNGLGNRRVNTVIDICRCTFVSTVSSPLLANVQNCILLVELSCL